MVLKQFLVNKDDTRLIACGDALYKIKLVFSSSSSRVDKLSPREFHEEIQELVGAVICLIEDNKPIPNIDTKHFSVTTSLKRWKVGEMLIFEQDGKELEAYTKVINLTFQPLSEKQQKQQEARSSVRVPNVESTTGRHSESATDSQRPEQREEHSSSLVKNRPSASSGRETRAVRKSSGRENALSQEKASTDSHRSHKATPSTLTQFSTDKNERYNQKHSGTNGKKSFSIENQTSCDQQIPKVSTKRKVQSIPPQNENVDNETLIEQNSTTDSLEEDTSPSKRVRQSRETRRRQARESEEEIDIDAETVPDMPVTRNRRTRQQLEFSHYGEKTGRPQRGSSTSKSVDETSVALTTRNSRVRQELEFSHSGKETRRAQKGGATDMGQKRANAKSSSEENLARSKAKRDSMTVLSKTPPKKQQDLSQTARNGIGLAERSPSARRGKNVERSPTARRGINVERSPIARRGMNVDERSPKKPQESNKAARGGMNVKERSPKNVSRELRQNARRGTNGGEQSPKKPNRELTQTARRGMNVEECRLRYLSANDGEQNISKSKSVNASKIASFEQKDRHLVAEGDAREEMKLQMLAGSTSDRAIVTAYGDAPDQRPGFMQRLVNTVITPVKQIFGSSH